MPRPDFTPAQRADSFGYTCRQTTAAYVEAGTILGYWSRRSASRIGDAVYYGASPQMLRRMIKRCDTPP